jgi:hypothetical protein
MEKLRIVLENAHTNSAFKRIPLAADSLFHGQLASKS